MKVLVVDDEKNARENLIRRLDVLDLGIEVLGEAESVADAKTFLKNVVVDLVFLDIEMPDENGFDLLNHFEEVPFKVVFVTAYNEYAIKAFEYLAQGYLLKPIDNVLLKKVLKNVLSMKLEAIDHSIIHKLDSLLGSGVNKRLAIPMEHGLDIIDQEQIKFIEASDGYSIIHLIDQQIVSSKRLVYYEENLPSSRFLRIHRKYIVNINEITRYRRNGEITLSDNTVLPVSKNSRQLVKEAFL